jgi:glycosyltransferase involved in cell wall biosynthesis
MVVGIDARAAAEVQAGRGRVVRELLAALAGLEHEHRFALYCRRAEPALELDQRFAWHRLPAPDPLWHAFAAAHASRSCDVFLSTNSYLTVWFLRVPSVAIVYDLVAFRPGSRAQRRASLIERATISPAVRRAARLVCISEATRKDLVERFPAAEGKSVVVPLAAGTQFRPTTDASVLEGVRGRYGLEGSFVLSVGTIEPRKNLSRLVEAYAALPASLRDGRELVLVGPRGWETEELAAGASDGGRIRMLGYVPDEDLAALYASCDVFCYPALYEGFGLPVLEAMSCGAAVVTSKSASLPEVGGDAARYVDPTSVESIRDGLAELLSSETTRVELRERGLRRAREFSWESTARSVLREIESAATKPRRAAMRDG